MILVCIWSAFGSAAEHGGGLLTPVPTPAQGVRETKEDRALDRARADVADAYDSFDMRMEMHWSDKQRGDMTERDWRIFREDYSIAYKGAALGATALPLRNWEEGNLPKPLMKAIERQVRRQLAAHALWSAWTSIVCVVGACLLWWI